MDSGEVWDLDDVIESAWVERAKTEFPGGVVMGTNRSDLVFLLDAGNVMGHGPEAIYAVDNTYFEKSAATLAARDLATFLAALQRGDRPWRAKPPQ